jgi:hypothetical protein
VKPGDGMLFTSIESVGADSPRILHDILFTLLLAVEGTDMRPIERYTSVMSEEHHDEKSREI